MSKNTYTPISGKKNDFALVDDTIANEERIHAIQVRFLGIDLEQRKAICELHNWKYEDRLPEFSADLRISIAALDAMLKRTASAKKDELRPQMEELVTKRIREHKEGEAVEALAPIEYWHEMALALFKNFVCDDPAQLRFKEIQRAHLDFFG